MSVCVKQINGASIIAYLAQNFDFQPKCRRAFVVDFDLMLAAVTATVTVAALSVSTSLSVIKILFLFVCHISIIYSVYLCISYFCVCSMSLYIRMNIRKFYGIIGHTYICCESYFTYTTTQK